MMSRPMALGLVLLVLILTSQSDWKQDTKPELEETSSPVTKREVTNLEVVRREIILIQEKEVHELKLRVKGLEEQLKKCQFEVPDNSTNEVMLDLESERTELVNLNTELVEPVSAKTAKLRGTVGASGGIDLPERPSELSATGDAFEMVDEEEDKSGNW